MVDGKLVSVVVPTHLRPTLLARAVRSALEQTVRPSEIVVVDDACDAVTSATVAQLAERAPVRYVENRERHGVSSSRNIGADVACGDVVAFLDDDDYWAPTYLLRALERMDDTGADAVVTWRTDGAESSLRTYRTPHERLTVRDVVVSNPGVVGSNICVRRDVIRRMGGFDEALPVSEDVDFFVRFLAAGHRYSVVQERLVLVGNASGPRLTDSTQYRIDGMWKYFYKHRSTMTRLQRASARLRIARAQLRMRRDGESRGWRKAIYTVGIVGLSRPQGRRDFDRLVALLRDY